MRDIRTNEQLRGVVLPINLLNRLDSPAGPELEQFIQARWLMTAAILRQALQQNSSVWPAERKQ